jgi:SagB-type dehydrogenase family enzyme
MTAAELAVLLWSAYGIPEGEGGASRRTVPSAGGICPLTIYVVIGKVEGRAAGVYRYVPDRDGTTLELVKEGDVRASLTSACLDQGFVAAAPATIVVAGDSEKICETYGARGGRYLLLEAGHVGQNLYLACEGAGLATVAVGAFHDAEVSRVAGLPRSESPLYVFPVGQAR